MSKPLQPLRWQAPYDLSQIERVASVINKIVGVQTAIAELCKNAMKPIPNPGAPPPVSGFVMSELKMQWQGNAIPPPGSLLVGDLTVYNIFNWPSGPQGISKPVSVTPEIKFKIDEGNYIRACGDALCKKCGLPFKRHDFLKGFEWLNILCDGTLVKL